MLQNSKSFKSYSEQIELLESRGLIIDDYNYFYNYLQIKNYYRLSGYWYIFQVKNNNIKTSDFANGVKSSDIINLYDFDVELRNICFKLICIFEISLKAYTGHALGETDPLIHLDLNKLNPNADDEIINWYKDWTKKLENHVKQSSNKPCVKHHNKNYCGQFPIWAAVEIIDFGSLSKLYSIASKDIQTKIIKKYGIDISTETFASWLSSINDFRNQCAHQQRIWDSSLKNRPKISKNIDNDMFNMPKQIDNRNHNIYSVLTIIQLLTLSITGEISYELSKHIDKIDNMNMVNSQMMGFPLNWRELELWKMSPEITTTIESNEDQTSFKLDKKYNERNL
ncbi:MAG: Abi family protein [Bifidobacteriaceae bacterium]|jgi:abortive infection bacteriophage resistance protein|nr:Abi family protein [Bifidobacteriaceae bacterium]